mmetsp:Transcript_1802/g.2388  ORF Transcript_1802/g.2388 Transcript_1802/m.2388 type:complete len:102 (+) Transcript_1802:1004-1309(+)
MRYSTCLPTKFKKLTECGQRQLWKHGTTKDLFENEEEAWVDVQADNTDQDFCLWRLFNDDPRTLFKWLDYEIYFHANATENVDLLLFDFDPFTGSSKILED